MGNATKSYILIQIHFILVNPYNFLFASNNYKGISQVQANA